MDDCRLFVLEEGKLRAKKFSEILLDLSRIANVSEKSAAFKLNEFFTWVTGYIDGLEYEGHEGGYIQDFKCPTYNLEEDGRLLYAVLPMHILEDVLEAMWVLEEVET